MKKYISRRFICSFIILVFISGMSNLLYGDNLSLSELPSDLVLKKNICINQELALLDKNNDIYNNEYKESSFRRFEIVFFISLPISFFLSLGGTLLYKGISGNKGNLSNIEYGYIALSSVGISMSVALRDYFIIKRSIEKQ